MSGNDTINNTLYETVMQDDTDVYLYPAIIIIGSFSNILTLIVFIKGKQQNLSVSYYLGVFSVTNLLHLFFNVGLHWLTMVSTGKSIETSSDFICAIWSFLYRIITFSGVWILLAVTVDRYIAVCHPHHAATICSVFMAKVAIIVIYIGLIVVSVHAMWTYHILDNNGTKPIKGDECNYEPDNHVEIWIQYSATCYIYIPSILLLFFDILLICGICINGRRSTVSRQECVATDFKYTVLALSNLFLLLSGPATIVNIKDHLAIVNNSEVMNVVRNVVNQLILGIPISPIFVCVIFSRTFRQDMYYVFSGNCKVKIRNRGQELKAVSTGSTIQLEVENYVDNTLV